MGALVLLFAAKGPVGWFVCFRNWKEICFGGECSRIGVGKVRGPADCHKLCKAKTGSPETYAARSVTAPVPSERASA